MTEHIIFAGAGGQGIMLMAKVLAQAAMINGRYITWLPSYGAEVRGGTARCMLTISETKIGSPYFACADALIVMNQPSLMKFLPALTEGGLLVVNTSLAKVPKPAKKIKMVKIAATQIALDLGNIKVANIVALGAYLSQRKLIAKHTLIDTLSEMAKAVNPKLFQINKKAFELGYNG
ncbi:MAG: 2-oxoacid:acceptor oxidoreductase family protein [Candidatus Omnitrophica bacterium]|nr:2-oxoacid:acceptor oxidoreductase family protein [Candidatus Omnitrophota bacterium]